jgi:hypothetical protein
MRKALVFTLVALAAAGAAWAGNSAPSASGGAHLIVHDVFGLHTLELQAFSFNAPDGQFEYREIDDGTPFTASGAITCLTVIGNDAWIGGVIGSSNDPTYVGSGAWWHVTDNGEGSNSPADITTFMGAGTLAETAAFCETHPAYKHPFPIDGGNIQVRG